MTSFVIIRYGSASRKEQRSVIRFLYAKGHSASAVQSEMCPVYGDKCFTRPAIHVWCQKFSDGREIVVDDEEPDRRVVLTTDAMMATVDSFMQSDRCVMV